MIDFKYSIKNFKALNNGEFIKISPLTIFCGINSSGKSSILQSLLLISQSLYGKTLFPTFYPYRHRFPRKFYREPKQLPIFVFEGNYYHLLDYSNVVFENDINNEIVFKWDFKVEEKKRAVNRYLIKISCAINPEEEINEPFVKNIHIEKYGKEDKLGNLQIFKSDKKNRYNIIIQNYRIEKTFFTRLKHILDIKREEIPKIIENLSLKKVSILFNSIFPLDCSLDRTNYEEILTTLNLKPERFVKKSTKIFPPDLFPFDFIMYDFIHACSYLMGFYSTLRYIGPLREEPRRYYLLTDLRSLDIGLRGENSPQILILEQNRPVELIKIKKRGKNYDFSKKEELSLLDSLNFWLEEMNLQPIKPDTMERQLITRLLVNYSNYQPPRSSVAIPDVGFGLSQIFPVLIESLTMEKGAYLILEQPEIHLHPRLQAQLGDFLLCNAKLGKNFMVETHSEYLIKRLCLRIAQFKVEDLSKLISIYFVTPNENNRGSQIVEVRINEYGEILEWPKGFFDENDSAKILRAGHQKRIQK